MDTERGSQKCRQNVSDSLCCDCLSDVKLPFCEPMTNHTRISTVFCYAIAITSVLCSQS